MENINSKLNIVHESDDPWPEFCSGFVLSSGSEYFPLVRMSYRNIFGIGFHNFQASFAKTVVKNHLSL